MTRKPLTVVDVTKLTVDEAVSLYMDGFDVPLSSLGMLGLSIGLEPVLSRVTSGGISSTDTHGAVWSSNA